MEPRSPSPDRRPPAHSTSSNTTAKTPCAGGPPATSDRSLTRTSPSSVSSNVSTRISPTVSATWPTGLPPWQRGRASARRARDADRRRRRTRRGCPRRPWRLRPSRSNPSNRRRRRPTQQRTRSESSLGAAPSQVARQRGPRSVVVALPGQRARPRRRRSSDSPGSGRASRNLVERRSASRPAALGGTALLRTRLGHPAGLPCPAGDLDAVARAELALDVGDVALHCAQ